MSTNGKGLAKLLFGWPPERVALRETAWLDGLRGTAAFLVMVNHFSVQWTSHFFSAPSGSAVLKNINPDHGINFRSQGEQLWGFWRLPILRLSPIALIQAEEYEKLYNALGSSVVRRWFRLYLAGAIVTVLYLTLKIFIDDPFNRGAAAIVWEFIIKTEIWANPFDVTHITPFSTSHDFNWVMWTLPFEFSGSLFVFVALLTLGRIRNFQKRVAIIAAIAFYAMLKLHWDYWLFGSGLALADYVRHNGGFRKLSQSVTPQAHQLWCILLVSGALLMGWVGPMPWYSNPGYGWSANMPMPVGTRDKLGEGIIIWGVGSILVVMSSCHLAFIREAFEHYMIQYLGRVSFMLYLIHMLVNNGIALPLRSLIYDTFCTPEVDKLFDPPELYRAHPFFSVGVYVLLWAICLPITLILANLLEVHVDRPCLKFGRWVDNWLLDNSAEQATVLSMKEELHSGRSSSVDLREELGHIFNQTKSI